jgi:hypothetical protein
MKIVFRMSKNDELFNFEAAKSTKNHVKEAAPHSLLLTYIYCT